ncbi:phage portal protein [Cytobacillus firmus]|uniref:phage portal protein n=1 Tax=Cytobacillus firmus TaxID=1399 RepID=UPI0018CF8080|nr:phage portal protein [Cytobacillus firmus]MBG9548395.1 portal protein [Cytobacillus firmus]MBG9604513.1 portal protein [Cytobacillus firmus]MED1942128.1 phage portal protein [Cytobacillus firmus]
MNLIDKAIAVFNPEAGLKRAGARKRLNVVNDGYGNHGASTKKKSLLGWFSRPGSALEDIEYNITTLRSRSRDLVMGAPLATGAIKTARTNVIGSGLKLNAQIDAEYLNMSREEATQWETKVEREFALWAESIHCDAQRMNNFYELQQLAFISMLMSGDCFSLLPVIPRKGMPYDLRVQLLEADRVCNPDTHFSKLDSKLVNGVEINDFGEIVAYYVARSHPGSISLNNKWVRIEKFGPNTGRPNIIHLMESERPEQRRGVPILAPVMESLKQLSRYSEAELMAAVINGMYSVFITQETNNAGSDFGGIPQEDLVDDDDDTTIELGSGTVHFLEPNEKIQESNPGRPNPNFDGFVTSICRQIGAAVEIPYELLLKHFTASYSASRGALLEAWKMFRMRREWFANDFCQPIYEEFLAEGIAKGRIYAPGFFTDPLARKAYCGSEWNGPSQGQLDPLKEVNAAEKRVANGFSTRARETVELTGGDFFKNHELRVIEEKMRRESGLATNEKGVQTVEPPVKEDEGEEEEE